MKISEEQLQEWHKYNDYCLVTVIQEMTKVVDAARVFCQLTKQDMDELEGSQSMDIPVEFMALHEAVQEFDNRCECCGKTKAECNAEMADIYDHNNEEA